jgi:hypothetical protein
MPMPLMAGGLAQIIGSVQSAQRQVVSQARLKAAQVDVSMVAGLSWQRVRDLVVDTVSLGDLVEGAHGRADVAQAAARELHDIGQVATCLYALFGEVLPATRLLWAERLSQYDAPVSLRNLASLPRWAEIEYRARRSMQELVDWLFGRVDVAQPQAVALIGDLIRVCVLLASHAPIDQIITGHVPKPATVSPGGRIDLRALDPARLRVGMDVLLYRDQQVIARGVVDDLVGDQVAARVLTIHALDDRGQPATTVSLAKDAKVEYGTSATALIGGARSGLAQQHAGLGGGSLLR